MVRASFDSNGQTMTPTIRPDLTLPKGVKDFLPAKAQKIGHLANTLEQIFTSWGYRPVIPPGLEDLEALEVGLGPGLQNKTFRFDDRQGGRLVAFPPDITPQIARIVASRMQELPLPLRLSYSGRVLRHTEQQMGKDREVFQAGVELFGLDNPEADAETIAMAIEGLQAIGAEEFTIDIGQVEFVRAILADLPLPADKLGALQETIRRKDSSSLKALLDILDLPAQRKLQLLELPRLFGGSEVLDRAAAVARCDASRRALANLSAILEHLQDYNLERFVTFDLGEIRGLDYHTGMTFQGFLPGLGRAVCSGGRYDNLSRRYGYPLPATGFTFNLLNLLFALDTRLDNQIQAGTDLLLVQVGKDKGPARRAARALRAGGFSAARDIIRRGLDESRAYAVKMNFRFLLVIGEQGKATRLIRLADGSERTVELADIEAGRFSLNPEEEN